MNPASTGGWLFRHRGWLPAPLVASLLATAHPEPPSILAGALLTLLGEGLRLWAVRHIGPLSRTRGAAVGDLASGGPYRWSRNPLYVGNLLFYAGLAIAAWHPVGGIVLILVLHYHLVVGWEEVRLTEAHGEAYLEYCRNVPRWLGLRPALPPRAPRVTMVQVLRSERTTLLVLAVVWSVLLVLWAWRGPLLHGD